LRCVVSLRLAGTPGAAEVADELDVAGESGPDRFQPQCATRNPTTVNETSAASILLRLREGDAVVPEGGVESRMVTTWTTAES
jgi:hypothetical protein